jgi:hypothetical protein
MSGTTTDNLSLTNLVAGTYTFRLTVTFKDANSNTTIESDDAMVKVSPASAANPGGTESFGQHVSECFSAYPNPSSDKFTIEFLSQDGGLVNLDVYNAQGGLVSNVFSGNTTKGEKYQFQVDGSKLQRGIYFSKLKTASGVRIHKLMLTK